VGAGPVPTELHDETAKKIREKGGEFGTTTGRPRRIGWIDLVTLKHSRDVNGLTGLAFTRLDTLAGIDPVKFCVAYDFDGMKIERTPASAEELARCKPVYEELPGWKDLPAEEWRKISVKGMHAIPNEARNYMKKISEYLNVPIYMVSIGPGREDTIIIKDVF
jgi:adenylosuccinate synthase